MTIGRERAGKAWTMGPPSTEAKDLERAVHVSVRCFGFRRFVAISSAPVSDQDITVHLEVLGYVDKKLVCVRKTEPGGLVHDVAFKPKDAEAVARAHLKLAKKAKTSYEFKLMKMDLLLPAEMARQLFRDMIKVAGEVRSGTAGPQPN